MSSRGRLPRVVCVLVIAAVASGCVNDGVARDCDQILARLTAGESRCLTYCPTTVRCDPAAMLACALPPVLDCNGPYVSCDATGRVVVFTTGHPCDAGPRPDGGRADAAPPADAGDAGS